MMKKRTHVITILALAFALILCMGAAAFAAETETPASDTAAGSQAAGSDASAGSQAAGSDASAGSAANDQTVSDGPGYTYRVTIYAGRQGTFKGGSTCWKKDFHAGDSISISTEDLGLTLIDDKYYVRGFRVTGHDNDETTGVQRLQIDNIDTDVAYELAYGIKGAMVSYTVNYVDGNGNKLRDSDVYYGMPDDKPVVSYRYIDGYYPNAYNLAKTLSTDEKENVFTFTYTKGTPPQPRTKTKTILKTIKTPAAGTTNNGNTAAGAGAPGTAANPAGTAAPAQNGNNANNGDNADNGGGEGVAIGDNDTPLAGPQQYVDLDENETPLAGPGSTHSKRAKIIMIGSGIALAAGIILILLALIRRRKNRTPEPDAAQA